MENLQERHHQQIRDAAAALIGVADDTGASLVDVIAEAERFIVEETKVGDARKNPPGPGRRGYTLIAGRLAELQEP